MDRAQLMEAIGLLVDLADSWNDAAAGEDRGRPSDALVLSLWDDGSGRLGRRVEQSLEVEDFYEFDDFAGLVQALADEGVELKD